MESGEMKKQLQEVCKTHEIEIMYVFGSRSREIKECVDGKRSRLTKRVPDVDIGIKTAGKTRLSVREKVQVMTALEDLFEIERVDLVVLGEADPFLAANVVRGERLFCEDGQKADNYDLYVLRRAGDLAPLEREREKLIFREV
jgi:predicted nucleotidyltransferase